MKRKMAVSALALLLCMASTSTAFARGYGHGGYGGSHGGSHHSGYRGHGHHGLGVAFGIAGGLLLGSALLYAATPPPPAVVYGAPYAPYQPGVIVGPPSICVEDRTFTGEWRINRFDGNRVWVPYQYPVVRRYQVPCY